MMLGQVVLYEFIAAELSMLQLLVAYLGSIDVPKMTDRKNIAE